ncbi:NfeD family protein [Candidatus Cryosericum terrychapinii]|nr:NfeD family protein [Candidatus Cryosericum terrychapinii]
MIGFWITMAVVCAVVDAFLPYYLLVWFSGGAVAALLFCWAGFNMSVQFVMFFLVSFALMALVGRYINSRLLRGGSKMRTNTEEMIGKTASVVMALAAGGAGRVALKGTTWRAILNDEAAMAAVGEKVVVVSIEGVTLTVRKE